MRLGSFPRDSWPLLVAVMTATALICGCSDSGLGLSNPTDVFKHVTGSASLAEMPPHDLAEYLPSQDSTDAVSWPRPDALVRGHISHVELRFGFDRIEAPELRGSKPATETKNGDIRVYELTLSTPRVVIGNLTMPKDLCVLMLATNALAQGNDIAPLEGADISRIWLPIVRLDSDNAMLPLDEPEVARSVADGCVLLQESAVLRLSDDSQTIERIGAWTAVIDTFDGKRLSQLGNSMAELEKSLAGEHG